MMGRAETNVVTKTHFRGGPDSERMQTLMFRVEEELNSTPPPPQLNLCGLKENSTPV